MVYEKLENIFLKKKGRKKMTFSFESYVWGFFVQKYLFLRLVKKSELWPAVVCLN